MRVFALSDLHVDYASNSAWINQISCADYRQDVLILAGDVTHEIAALERHLALLASRFREVLFVPGNHEVWVAHEHVGKTSLEKLAEVLTAAERAGASVVPSRHGNLVIVPLLGWYDYSFGEPTDALRSSWTDFYACRWPPSIGVRGVAQHLDGLNVIPCIADADTVITFSHFVPRIDLLPTGVPASTRELFPILGSRTIDQRARSLRTSMHVYGHSHLNRQVTLQGVTYINNALGYPREREYAARRLCCIHEH